MEYFVDGIVGLEIPSSKGRDYKSRPIGAFSASGETWQPAVFAIGTLLSGEVVWRLVKWRKKGLSSN